MHFMILIHDLSKNLLNLSELVVDAPASMKKREVH